MEKDLSEIETKLSAARTRLILDKPFLGALVMHLPLVAADEKWCETTGTDARAFYYNPEFIRSLSLSQTQFVLAHEALHCALGHFARRNHREVHRWGVACDHAANLLLVDDGLKAPPGALLNVLYQDMTAEEIYPFIRYGTSEKTLDRHIFDGDSGGDSGKSVADEDGGAGMQGGSQASQQDKDNDNDQGKQGKPDNQPGSEQGDAQQQQDSSASADTAQPAELNSVEREELATQWRSRLASAAQQAKMAGRLSDSFARLLDHLLQPQLPWRMLLARYMKTVARDDYSFQRPSRREGEAIMPSLASGEVEIVVVLDTSGSISDDEMREFVSEVDVIKAQLRARITLHACDENLSENGPWIYEGWEPMRLPDNLTGGGGTRFTPVFEWVREQRRPDLLLYFTDAEGEFPLHEPEYPVLWLVKGKAPVPWGQRIQLN